MIQEFETSKHSSSSRSEALKELFMGKDDFSIQYTAQQNADNTWGITGHFYFSKKLLADELDTNRMLDLMIGLELGYQSDNRSINSTIREQKENPNHIVNLYQ